MLTLADRYRRLRAQPCMTAAEALASIREWDRAQAELSRRSRPADPAEVTRHRAIEWRVRRYGY